MAPAVASPSPAAAGALRYESVPGRWVIAATVLGSGMAAIDSTVVGIALPAMGREFHAPLAALQWVVSGYLLTLSALLVVGGTLGDRCGRRRTFVVGVAWFAVASAACSAAPDALVLSLTRIVQGMGAALLVPGSLAIIEASFVPDDRARAVGAWSGLGGVATAAGPLLGGYLISAVSWRWIFLINVPVGAAVLAMARHVPESRRGPTGTRRAVDGPGAFLAIAALAGITYGLVEGPALGWGSGRVAGALGVGSALAVAFVVVEATSPEPMVPLGLFRRRQFTVTNAVTVLVYAGLGGALFLLPVQLQVVDRYSALEAGVSLLPLTAVMLVFSARSGRLAARIGPRLQMSLGPVLVGGGLALLSRSSGVHGYPAGVLPGVLVLAVGLAVTVAPLTATALGSAPDDLAGLASAVNNDVARLGGLAAVAVLPAVAGIKGQTYLHPGALAHDFDVAIVVGAAWCAAGGVLAALGIRNPGPGEAHAAGAGATRRPEDLHCALDATPLVGD